MGDENNKNLEFWNKVKMPPTWAMKKITGGRLSGKTDINPQWRIKVLTENFGLCGIGWKCEIIKLWTEKAAGDEEFAFAEIKLFVKQNQQWSDPIPGIGGHMLIEKESKGLHSNDEAYKMCVTDALSVACKMLGIGADIYSGLGDGKYGKDTSQTGRPTSPPSNPKSTVAGQTIPENIKNNVSKVVESLPVSVKSYLKSFKKWDDAQIYNLVKECGFNTNAVKNAVENMKKKKSA